MRYVCDVKCIWPAVQAATTVPALEIRAAPTERVSILEMHIFQDVTYQNANFLIGRPQAIGVGVTASVPFLPEDPDYPPIASIVAIDWVKPPTGPAQAFRRVCTWTGQSCTVYMPVYFPLGLIINQGSSLVVMMTYSGGPGLHVLVVMEL